MMDTFTDFSYSTLSDLSSSEKPSKNALKRSIAFCTSCDPAVSRIECMESIAHPTSTVRTPIFDKKGPTVEPHALKSEAFPRSARSVDHSLGSTYMSLRTSYSCTFPPFFSISFLTTKLPIASLAYRCFAFVLMTTPPLTSGAWLSSCRLV